MAKDVVIPIEAKNLKNPLASNTDAVQEGQQIFMASCAMCHGTDGHARTGLGLAMYPPALDMTSPHVQHWTEAELFWIIQNGAERREMISGKAIQKACESFCILNPSELISPKVL